MSVYTIRAIRGGYKTKSALETIVTGFNRIESINKLRQKLGGKKIKPDSENAPTSEPKEKAPKSETKEAIQATLTTVKGKVERTSFRLTVSSYITITRIILFGLFGTTDLFKSSSDAVGVMILLLSVSSFLISLLEVMVLGDLAGAGSGQSTKGSSREGRGTIVGKKGSSINIVGK